MLEKKGFGDKFCDWVLNTVKVDKVAIKTNNVIVLTSLPIMVSDKGTPSPLFFSIFLLMAYPI
jgi:hypothetical protein